MLDKMNFAVFLRVCYIVNNFVDMLRSMHTMFWKFTCIKCNDCFLSKCYFFDILLIGLLKLAHVDGFFLYR